MVKAIRFYYRYSPKEGLYVHPTRAWLVTRATLRPTTLMSFTVLLASFTLVLPMRASALQGSWTDPGQWQTASSSLPQQLTDVMAVANGNYVYILGGLNNSVAPVDTVYYAKTSGGGDIGTWQTGTPLPVPVGYTNSAAIYDGYIYMFGGWSGRTNRTSETVYYAKLNGNGSVGNWQTGVSLPGVLSDTTVQVYNGYAYVIGGMPDREADSANVYYTKLNANGTGSVGSWSASSNTVLASDADRSSVVNDGYLYVFGGRDPNADVTSAVYSAKINDDGSLGSWTASANPLPQAEYNTSAVVNNGYVYVIGGMDAAGNNGSAVFYAKLNADGPGSVGSWSTGQGKLPQGENGAGSVVVNGTVYVVGGWSDAGQGLESTFYNVPTETITKVVKSKSNKDPNVPTRLLLVDGIAAVLMLIVFGMTLVMKRQSRNSKS